MRRLASSSSRKRTSGSIDVDVADREQIQRAAQHAQIVVLLAQRPHQRIDDRHAVVRKGSDRRCAGCASPVRRGESATMSAQRTLDPLRARVSAVSGHPPFVLDAAVTSSMVTMTPTIVSSSRSGPMVTCCCI